MIKAFKKNYKLIIGLMVGFLVSSTLVYALYMGRADELSYNNTGTWLKSTTVQDALDELNKQKGCPVGYSCHDMKTTLAVGDYVSYTPTKTSYTTDTSKTGCTSTQTIDPSELTSWRVLSINEDDTVDIISEYVSTNTVCFGGLTGYQNLVGYLNVLASQYENTGVTVGSRHFGYNGQTKYITDTQYFVNPAPWKCNTNGASGNCDPDPDDYEAYGGGDILYQADYNLVNTVFGTRQGFNKSGANSNYWQASRLYSYSNDNSFSFHYRWINGNSNYSSGIYSYNGSRFVYGSQSLSLRPIVTLSSELSYLGIGSKDYPMEIQ